MRKIFNINDNWSFIKEDISDAFAKEFNTSSWESVNVPHTWNALDGAAGNEFFRGACWYRKNLTDISDAFAKEFNTSSWESVNVPHTWNALDGAAGNEFFRGACWYRKNLTIDKLYEGKKIYIEFGAINSISNVYVNGVHLGEHRGGYSIIRYDITELVNFGGENTIAVKADNTAVERKYYSCKS